MADKEKERGRLFSIQIDGSDSVPFIIKKDKLLIGRGDSCEIRIYVDGVAHEHCILTFNEEGRGFIEAVNKCGLTFLNGELIERQVSLEHDDVITVVKRSFRFHYPSSSKFFVPAESAASFEDNMVRVLADFEVEDVFSNKEKELQERRVTFGPRLSPEEFDKNMPPASPLRKGSLPRDKLKAKTPSFEQEVIKSQIKKNLFMNSSATKVMKANAKSATPELPESSVVLRRLNCSPGNMKEIMEREISKPSRPLFSEIVKKSVPTKNIVQNVVQKCSPQKFIKKTKLKDSRKVFYKSPRRPVNPRLLAVGSTGHANSPETIIISKKRFNPNFSRNSVSSSKRRKSLRVLQEDITETNSESTGDVHENNSLVVRKTPIRTSVPEKRKSSAIKRKVNDENKADTPAKSRSEDTPYGKRNVDSIPSEDKTENYAPSRKSVGTPARKSVGTPARKSVGTPARKCVRTPARKSIGTPARKSISTPARKSIGTPAKRSTPASESLNTATMINLDEIPNEFDDDEPEEFHEDETETELLDEEVDENEAPSNSTSLVAAINNVAQIDENNLDKSLKDIHNIVQALSCHSNVPTLGNPRLTADMCTNAVKKLALTISMINAFHMYNRIIDDVSSFPLCFPSTSFESNSDSLRRLRGAPGNQNEDNVRMSRFQDIMQTFFSNSASSQRRRLLRSCEDKLSPDNESPLSNKRSRKSLKAIDSGHKTPTRKSSDSEIHFVNFDDVDELNHSDQSSSDNEGISAASPRSYSKSPRTPISHKEKASSGSNTRTSVSLGKDNSFHSPSLNAKSSDELSFSSELDLRKSKATRMSTTSAERQSTNRSLELISGLTNVSHEKPKSLEHKKSPIFKSGKTVKISPKKIGSILTTYSKMLRKRTSTILKPRTPNVSRVTKKFGMTTSKKLKAQKQEQKHRSDVLKKVKYRVASPKIKILKKTQNSPKPLRVSLKGIRRSSGPLKPRLVRLSQKIVKKAKSKKRLSPALRLSGKLLTSPKGLKEYGKRKSVLFKSKGIKNKKTSVSSRLSSQKRKSALGILSPEVANKRTKRSRSVNVKTGGIKKKSVVSTDIKKSPTGSDSEKIMTKTKNQRKRKISGGKLTSPAAKKRSDTINEENATPVNAKSQSPKKDSVKAKTRNQRNKRVKSDNLDLIVMNEKSDAKESDSEKVLVKPAVKNQRKRKAATENIPDAKENDSEKVVVKPAAKNQRKRKAATENIPENEQPEKRLKTVEKGKNKEKPKTKVSKTRGKSTQAMSNEESESTTLSEEVSVSVQTDKKSRTTKRKQKSETKMDSPKPQRSTRTTRRQDTQDTEMEDVEVKANKKTAKRSKTTENKKSELNKPITSPPKRNTRTTRRKNLQTVENEEFLSITPDLEKVDKKRERKRKVDKSTPARIPEVADKKITTEKDKKKMSPPKDTPKKGRSKAVSKRGKIQKEASPVQRVQRSLRSRK